ncbi:MAG: tRNA (cytidine(34)-2'-O)-methyltransferase [Zoogloea sp.]|jgi:tRNA (cytidine/uridine-2'-O-)-methyltransferase|uniref:tRNA (cytidine(34)-2'-O)-methyltransferase n=1 Tax=Dokdonella sp. TaxID=2291710 RepID=UPI001B48604B|nr:tRNA (cytidine(34)-2'-O)-methyltransferase [Dokdonella sp.]MBL0284940.1 tRNA (cytidine(34)-2'-O)-methyltransferase [Zoogloea sp.]MBP7392445.1 tRNA (cytidine(34)-2'-O)-methyltransferase [Zoogloea sp.]
MFHVVLHQPEIPPNTGNIMRMCANSGARLHLVKPLGFTLEEKQLIRAGLDYRDMAVVTVHEDWPNCRAGFSGQRIFALTSHGGRSYAEVAFEPGDVFVFGSESRGLPPELHTEFGDDRRLRIPMRPGNRSLNLSNAAAVVVYEAWRQAGFDGGA